MGDSGLEKRDQQADREQESKISCSGKERLRKNSYNNGGGNWNIRRKTTQIPKNYFSPYDVFQENEIFENVFLWNAMDHITSFCI